MNAFGRELRKIRIDIGITQQEMARCIGISAAMLSSVENSRKAVPLSLIDLLADSYKPIAERKSEFVKYADETKKEVRITLGGRAPVNQVALMLEKKYYSLTDRQALQILQILSAEDCVSTR